MTAEASPATKPWTCGECSAKVPPGLAMIRWRGVCYCPVCAPDAIPKVEYDAAMNVYVRAYIMGES